ncbi:MAG: sulfotransferase domain-containing protein [Acidimicrobiia bacterium]|nr:sulfotransferase domain-containing protein [Acidimicrobiia bacterium]
MRANAIIAGAEKAGTTSLFVSLAGHPDVAPASVKETRYFSPLIYGSEPEPVATYDEYFADSGGRPVRLEATPRYCTGGRAVAERIEAVCGPTTRVIVVLRDPVARFASFFTFQKARLRLPEDLSVEQYLERSVSLSEEALREPENHPWSAFPSGCYADWLPGWHKVFGDRLRVLFFEQLTAEPEAGLRSVASFLGINAGAFPTYELASENRTTAYKRAGFQRAALAVNDRLERFLRRHYRLRARMRSVYYRINGKAAPRAALPDAVRAELERRYREPNARLAGQLRAMGYTFGPTWLEASGAQYSSAE